MANKIKKGDQVVVISGKDRGNELKWTTPLSTFDNDAKVMIAAIASKLAAQTCHQAAWPPTGFGLASVD